MEIEQCEQYVSCLNSIEVLGIGRAKCGLCRFSPTNGDYEPNPFRSYWKPCTKGIKHPVLEAEKIAKKKAKHKAQVAKRLAKDRDKVKLLKKAELSEKKTAESIVKATKNSGRLNKDGDMTALNLITIDAKLQSTRLNPEVDLLELEKVRNDAKRAGNEFGVLALKNKLGKEVVIMDLADFSKILARLKGD